MKRIEKNQALQLKLSEKNQALQCQGKLLDAILLVQKYHHALVEQVERVSKYMERLWSKLEKMQSGYGENDFQIIEALLNEKDEILKDIK